MDFNIADLMDEDLERRRKEAAQRFMADGCELKSLNYDAEYANYFPIQPEFVQEIAEKHARDDRAHLASKRRGEFVHAVVNVAETLIVPAWFLKNRLDLRQPFNVDLIKSFFTKLLNSSANQIVADQTIKVIAEEVRPPEDYAVHPSNAYLFVSKGRIKLLAFNEAQEPKWIYDEPYVVKETPVYDPYDRIAYAKMHTFARKNNLTIWEV